LVAAIIVPAQTVELAGTVTDGSGFMVIVAAPDVT